MNEFTIPTKKPEVNNIKGTAEAQDSRKIAHNQVQFTLTKPIKNFNCLAYLFKWQEAPDFSLKRGEIKPLATIFNVAED
jgi:hypothetical protein